MGDKAPEKATCHPEFYQPHGTFIIQVENTLYKLSHDALANESTVFADLFSLDTGPESNEGKADETPIVLEHLTVKAFDLFVELKFACARPIDGYSLEELESLLEFHRKYDCSPRMLNFITSCIMEKSFSCHPSKLVHLGREYKIRKVFERGFSRLCDIPIMEFDTHHHMLVGMDVYISYIYTRVRLDYFIRSVTVRYPPIEHADSCHNHKGCAEDWAAVWWNAKCKKITQFISGDQREYLVYEEVSMSDYVYIMNCLEKDENQRTWNRLTYFPNSQRLMVSSPSAAHESVLHAIMKGLDHILDTIPLSKSSVTCQMMTAHSVDTVSVEAVPDLTVMMCTKAGQAGRPIWLMECAFSQSDHNVMRKLNTYVQDIPSVLVVGKILIKQAEKYRSPGSNCSIAPRLRSSDLMTMDEWTGDVGVDEYAHVVVDGHTWFLLSSVEIHLWMRQPGKPWIEMNDLNGDGYAFGTLYPTVDLDNINSAFQRGLERVKEVILLHLDTASNLDRQLHDLVARTNVTDAGILDYGENHTIILKGTLKLLLVFAHPIPIMSTEIKAFECAF
ncbi:hypothetical protein EDC04DRAFT_2904708 [Pisolithus marmoratus]|nr:hypothetical protein EDC04DRAFT_2904708 [Pisolithus marmoratus]